MLTSLYVYLINDMLILIGLEIRVGLVIKALPSFGKKRKCKNEVQHFFRSQPYSRCSVEAFCVFYLIYQS